MAVLDSILPVVSRSTSLALELYRVAASSSTEAAKDLIRAAGTTNSFASVLKQVGTIIKEDDRLPSHEAIESLEDIIEQFRTIATEIDSISALVEEEVRHQNGNLRWSGHEDERRDQLPTNRLPYLTAHLEALRDTISVLLQTLYTAQSVVWSKLRPTISPQQTTKAVNNERLQLECLIIEQQLSILSATSKYEHAPSGNERLLMEGDSSQSLVAAGRGNMPSLGRILVYQHRDLASIDKSPDRVANQILSVRAIASLQADHLLERWTCLPQVKSQIEEMERESRDQQRESRQPMVESDEEDDHYQRRKLAGAGTRMSAPSQRSGSIEPLFTDTSAPPTPARDSKYGPTAPLSPAASPRTSRNSLGVPINDVDSPVSPRSSITSFPVEAAAAVEAKEEDEDLDLEIPWQLCTRKHYWKYIDGKIVSSNTDQLPSVAFLERNSWTEIMASWVCKEAIREAGYKVTQVQKDVRDGRRTKFETCFCIERPLQFEQVKNLVERTVDIYRQRRPPSPPPARRSSFNRPPPPPLKVSRPHEIDRDRTPKPSKTHPPLGRIPTAIPIPPPLQRSTSGQGSVQGSQKGVNPPPQNLQMPMSPGPYSTSVPQNTWAQMQQPQQYQQQQKQQAPMYNSPQGSYPPNAAFNNAGLPPRVQQAHNISRPQSSLGQSHPRSSKMKYDEDLTTDSDSSKDRRRRRSKSRGRYAPETKKRSHNKSKAAGVLMGVGGLTALLDGLSGL